MTHRTLTLNDRMAPPAILWHCRSLSRTHPTVEHIILGDALLQRGGDPTITAMCLAFLIQWVDDGHSHRTLTMNLDTEQCLPWCTHGIQTMRYPDRLIINRIDLTSRTHELIDRIGPDIRIDTMVCDEPDFNTFDVSHRHVHTFHSRRGSTVPLPRFMSRFPNLKSVILHFNMSGPLLVPRLRRVFDFPGTVVETTIHLAPDFAFVAADRTEEWETTGATSIAQIHCSIDQFVDFTQLHPSRCRVATFTLTENRHIQSTAPEIAKAFRALKAYDAVCHLASSLQQTSVLDGLLTLSPPELVRINRQEDDHLLDIYRYCKNNSIETDAGNPPSLEFDKMYGMWMRSVYGGIVGLGHTHGADYVRLIMNVRLTE